MAVAAAQAGKAVVCEKPLARNLSEARLMLAAARRAKTVNLVCHNYRRIPAVALARQLIESRRIGRAHFATSAPVTPRNGSSILIFP